MQLFSDPFEISSIKKNFFYFILFLLFIFLKLSSHAAHAEDLKQSNQSLKISNNAAVSASSRGSAVSPSEETFSATKDSVGGNPAFTNFDPGTGALGRYLQFPDDWGVRLGGVSLADTNKLFTGGNKPGSVASNQAFILGTSVDAEKAIGWKGGSIGVNFLQVNVQNTNGYADLYVNICEPIIIGRYWWLRRFSFRRHNKYCTNQE